MAIIAFWSNEEKETGQTMSMVALTTYMAIEHNNRILSISTDFNDDTLEKCYFQTKKSQGMFGSLPQSQSQVGIENGVEGLIKLINSNKTAGEGFADYTKIVFRDRLDVLCPPRTKIYDEYKRVCTMYPNILQTANKSYDYVFIDVSKHMPKEQVKQILELADVIVINITQRLKTINGLIKLKEKDNFFKKNNILLNIGRYDRFSKYNTKNITRYMREKNAINGIPYNTLFFEASVESKVAELFLRIRKIDPDDRNAMFIAEIAKFTQNIIYKVQEQQMRM